MVPTLLTGDQLVAAKYRLRLQPVFLADRPDAGFLRAAARQDAGARRRHRLSPATRSLDDLCEAPDRPAGRSHPDEGRTALHQRCHRASPPRRPVHRRCRRTQRVDPVCRDAAGRARARDHRDVRCRPHGRHAGVRRAAQALLHDGRQPRQLGGQPHLPLPTAASASSPRTTWWAAPTWSCCRAIRPSPGPTSRNGRTPSGRHACWAASTSTQHDRHLAFRHRPARPTSSRCWRSAST